MAGTFLTLTLVSFSFGWWYTTTWVATFGSRGGLQPLRLQQALHESLLIWSGWRSFVNERWVSEPAMRPNLNRAAVKTWGAAAVTALFACVLAPLSDYMDPESWSPWANATFITLCRPMWAAGLGIIATLCAAGQLEGLNAFLAPTPFARLTFGAYLMHPVVIKWFAGTATSSYHFGWRYMMAHALFNSAFSFLFAAIAWLLVERPVMSAMKRGTRARRDE